MAGEPHGSAHGPERLPFRQVGAYRLVGLLGEGPGSSRYLCRRDDAAPLRALELLPSGLDPHAREQVRLEAQAAARLDHPGLAPPLEVGEHNGRVFLITEHVPGPTLAERLEREGSPSPAEALELGRELLEALAAAHARGVVHRALEPGVIVVDARSGRVRVSGFGLGAANVAARLTSSARDGAPTRAAHYQPPDLLRGGPPSARADVFSLGVILYELLTGARPFTGRTAAELAERLRAGGAQPPSRRSPRLDPRLDEVLLSALATDPQGRPGDAGALLAALRRVTAPPPAPAGAGAWTVWAASLACGALLGLVAAAWPLRQVSRERERAAAAQSRVEDERGALAALGEERRRLQAEAELLEVDRGRQERERAGARALRESMQELLGSLSAYCEGRLRQRAEPRQELLAVTLAALQPVRDRPAAAMVCARWLLALGRAAEAGEALQAARAAGLTDPDLPVLEFHALAGSGRTDEARQLLRELAQGPASAQALWASSFDASLGEAEREARLTKAVALHPGASYLHVALHRAIQAGLRGQLERTRLERALGVIQEAVRLDPASPDLLFERSSDVYHLWLAGERREGARVPVFMADLERARGLRASSTFWSYAAKAWCFLRRGTWAVAEAEVALRLAEQGPVAEQGLARVWAGAAWLLVGREAEAARAWEEGLAKAPNLEFLQALGDLTPERRQTFLARLSPQAQGTLQALARGR